MSIRRSNNSKGLAMSNSGFKEFCSVNKRALAEFEQNQLCRKIATGEIRMKDYESYLLSIFHQTFHAAVSFAAAGANCPNRFFAIRDYLIKHAGEEHSHWQWV